ncbi:NtPRp27-like protein [Cocos nucifera]|uniref:NtPRp27-like protein n=1 Tax=Cocos nucifera TaxID=13894 RepID=A0A8K0IHC2_COCNU|nr:NtPRp27-like protein [Cocos nucifera]
MALLALFVASVLASATLDTARAVEYEVSNNAAGTPGGNRFDNEIGLDYSKQVLEAASSFIWSIFEQSEGDRKDVQLITLVIETMDGVAFTSAYGIHVSANYIARYTGDVKTEITGVLYHEMTHVWQWNGNGAAPGGLIEGMADYVRLKAGYAPSHWVKPGQGNRWDQGYDVTARFLDYCDSLKSGFVAQLNARMKNGYSDGFFVELLGKTVDQLWNDYKAKYGG